MGYNDLELDGPETAILQRGVPHRVILEDQDLIVINTLQKRLPVCTIARTLTGIVLRNVTTGKKIPYTLLSGMVSKFDIGTSALGADFYGVHAGYHPNKNLTIEALFNPDNKVQLDVVEFDGSLGTVVDIDRNALAHPVNIVAGQPIQTDTLIANGAETITVFQAPDGSGSIITNKGTRGHNEDGALLKEDVVAVADGMGGYLDGARSAAIVLGTIDELSSQSNMPTGTILRKALLRLVLAQVSPTAGTTLTMARRMKEPNGGRHFLEVLNIADSKGYGFALPPSQVVTIIATVNAATQTLVSGRSSGTTLKTGMVFQTKDQSQVQKRIDDGTDPPIARYTANDTNIVRNGIHPGRIIKDPEVIKLYYDGNTIIGQDGERYAAENFIVVLVSDGVSDVVSPEEIQGKVQQLGLKCGPEIEKLARSRYKEKKWSMQFGGQNIPIDIERGGDNITVVVKKISPPSLVHN